MVEVRCLLVASLVSSFPVFDAEHDHSGSRIGPAVVESRTVLYDRNREMELSLN